MKPPKRLKAGVPGKKECLSVFICAYINIQSKQKNSPLKKNNNKTTQSSWKSKTLELKEARISNRTPFLCSQGFGSLHCDGGNEMQRLIECLVTDRPPNERRAPQPNSEGSFQQRFL